MNKLSISSVLQTKLKIKLTKSYLTERAIERAIFLIDVSPNLLGPFVFAIGGIRPIIVLIALVYCNITLPAASFNHSNPLNYLLGPFVFVI